MVVERATRQATLAVLAAVLAAVTLALGAAGTSSALLGRALGVPSGKELRAGASTGLSSGGLRARLGDRAGTTVRGARQAAAPVTPVTVKAGMSSPGGQPALPVRPVTADAAAGLVFVLTVLCLALSVGRRGRPAGRAPPYLPGT